MCRENQCLSAMCLTDYIHVNVLTLLIDCIVLLKHYVVSDTADIGVNII